MIPEISETLMGSSTKSFGTLRQKNWQNFVIPPIMHKFFRYPKFLETLKGRARKVSGTVRPKFFDGKTWFPPVIHKPFRNQKFSRKTVRFPFASFWHSETKQIRPKIVICPLLSVIFFRWQKFSGKQKSSFTKQFVSDLWDKKFQQNHDAPLLSTKIFLLPEIFWNTYQKCSSTKFLGTLRQKNVDTKSWHNSLKRKIFRYPKLVTHWRIPLRKISALWDKKKFDRKSWYSLPPPLLLNKIFFDTIKLWEKKGSPTKFFGTVRQQIFFRKLWCSPLRHKVFPYPKFSETQTGSLTKFFGNVRKKNFDTKSWHNSLKRKVFRYPKLVTHWRVPRRNFSALLDESFSTENRDTLLHKVQKSVVELMFVRIPWKLISKQ